MSESQTDPALIDLYAHIGSIASTWASLENAVDVTIWRIAGLDHHDGACITVQINSLQYRLLALFALLDRRIPEADVIKKLHKFIQDSAKLARCRNRAVHDPVFVTGGGKIEVLSIGTNRKLEYQFAEKTADYREINLEIAKFLERYLALEQEIDAALQARRQEIRALTEKAT